jgi:mono/diheme cytochrome c family protein
MFGQHCASCHDDDGSGGSARADLPRVPDFRTAAWQARHSDARLLASIIHGRGADMPPFRGDLTDAQARELVNVVRGFGPPRQTASGLSGGDFTSRFQALEREFEALEQRLQGLRAPARR